MKVALVGNQNSGKTTLFNLLTGTNQKVGNWPGVTIERKSGTIKNTDIEIVDLPGIYSLSPYTSEEDVSRKYVIEEKPDVIINIIDTTELERSLYLTTQLLELDVNVLVALNMEDLLQKKGITINAKTLEEQLHTTVVQISALKGTGIDELINKLKNNDIIKNAHNKIYNEDIEAAIEEISNDYESNKRFMAVKTLEKDKLVTEEIKNKYQKVIDELVNTYKTDMEEEVANQRYNYIVGITATCETKEPVKESITDKLDKVFLNKFAALPIFACIMFLIYFLAVGVVGSATVDLVDGGISALKDWFGGVLSGWGASDWIVSLICDGIIAGVGAVLNFVPQLIILFICISLLETTGYMSRIAFFLDLIFKKFGLSGKSLIPFIVGAGCSVPGVMSARTVEDETERRMTIMLTPFIPCSAKLPIIALFAGYFFDKHSGLVSASLYFLAIAVILLSAIIMKKFVFKSGSSSFISELPEYKLPSFKYVARDVIEKVLAFIKRAGTIILLCSVVVWLLLSFTWKAEYIENDLKNLDGYNLTEIANEHGIEYTEDSIAVFDFNKDGYLVVSFGTMQSDESYEYSEFYQIDSKLTREYFRNLETKKDKNRSVVVTVSEEDYNKIAYDGNSLTIENSILASIGKVLSPVFYPVLGQLNWAATVSAIQGLVAKEQVVSSMAIIAGYGESVDDGKIIFGSTSFAGFTGLSAYAFMVFNLFSAPCFGAIGAMRRELGSKKRMWQAILFQTGTAWVLASLIFGIGSIFA